ncbi:hypothetical protein C8R43DRAFT_1003926 [Mycena crocata]|nr:hypothetical protein C8R43DRAFT_1003926 [Mycena crocata]
MASMTASIIDAASRAPDINNPISLNEIRYKLEWVWGLPYETLDEHTNCFNDRHLAQILADETLILVPDPESLRKIFSLASCLPMSVTDNRETIQDVYQGATSFDYLVLPVDPSSAIRPRILTSQVPPHLTICPSADKISRLWGPTYAEFIAIRDSLVKLVNDSPPIGASFILDDLAFSRLEYIHESWGTCYVPPSFRGLDDPPFKSRMLPSEPESSTMEWEIRTLADEEPHRRLLPHEFEREPDLKFFALPVDESEDDDVSCDSQDPEVIAKASILPDEYETEHLWLKGMESWAQEASSESDENMLLNDGQIEADDKEQPRVATSLDLGKPDYLQLSRYKKSTATRT